MTLYYYLDVFYTYFLFCAFCACKILSQKKINKKIKFKTGLMTSFILLLNLSAMQRMQKDICKEHWKEFTVFK